MAINISIITTANRARSFKQESPESINQLLEGLKRSANIFSGKPLIIGSGTQTTIFAAASIACIELETDLDIDSYLPGKHDATITALNTEEAIAPFQGGIDGNNFSARIDFHFLGGHVINAVIKGERKTALADRLMNLTGLFERPIIFYKLPQGGVGMMNPHAMTRSVVSPGIPDLPTDAWIAEAL